MGREFWLVTLLVLLLLCVLSLNHFLPLLMNYSVLPRGSFGFPLVGETLAFLEPHTSTSIGAFLQNHCERYGKVFKSHLFLSPTVVSCDQELNNYILQNEEKLFQCSYPKPILGILGKHSLLVAVSDQHKKLRNVALSLIVTTKSKPQFINDVETIALQILNSWKDKDQVIFCQEARKYTFNVIVKQVLGLTPNEPETTQILQDFVMFMKGLVSLPLNIPGTPYARAIQARNRISSTVKAIIRSRKIDHDGNSNSSVRSNKRNTKKDDFLEILVSVDSLTEDEKVSFVLDSLLGGYETTSLLMAMTVLFLGQCPPAIVQLKQEHESIRMKKDGDFLSWGDYNKMDFTQKVINEALRYGNIVKFVHRKALKDIQFRDYVIPGGWKVLPVFSAVHLDPTLHADAFHFNPWRWENDKTCKKFTPFGGGSRLCPGFELAKVEVAFFLHHLIHSYRWEIEDDQPIAYPYVEFTRGLKLNLHRCSSA